MFKAKFQSLANVRGINHLDVLNKLPNWLRGAPKRLTEAFNGAEDPRAAVQDIWIELDGFYNYRAKTAEERIKPMMAKGKIEKDDVSAIIDMLADMKAIFHEARMDSMDSHLNRGDIVRQIIMGKIPYASEEFYRKESKKRRKTPGFSMSFDDIIMNIRERAEILKSQGKNSQKIPEDPKAKVASMQTHGERTPMNKVVQNSPTREQPPLPKRTTCNFCNNQHASLKCPTFLGLTRDARVKKIVELNLCLRRMSPDHISNFCPCQRPKCDKCSGPHLTILHYDEGEYTPAYTQAYTPAYSQQRGYNRTPQNYNPHNINNNNRDNQQAKAAQATIALVEKTSSTAKDANQA